MKLMSSKKNLRVKKNGIFYTPESIAGLLARQAIKRGGLSILDPACGEGALLKAMVEEGKRFGYTRRPRLVGCDRFKPRKLDHRIEFVRCDFFAYKAHEKFDVILTNPPYVRSARINVKDRERYRTRYAKPLGFSSNLDLWVYFLIKSTMHLIKGGTIGAVLPWSFLEAEYAQKVRGWIAENFATVRVLVLQGAHFKDTVKRVLMVWLEGYGSRAQCVQIGCADECTSNPGFQELPMEIWNSENVMAGLNPTKVTDIAQRLREAGFRPLEEYADVAIGIVTGANDYFILSGKEADELGFSRRSVLPVLTSVQDLGRVAGQESPGKVLLQFKRMTNKKRKYVSEGVESRLHKRIHCQRREKQKGAWYNVDTGPVPGAFFTYRVSTLPYLILNMNGYQCTNALHKVLFDGVSKTGRKWIQLSLLSLFGQLSLEIGARHYGNGIMKVEPKTLKRALVYAGGTRVSKAVYEKVLQDIAAGRKEKACTEATQLVVRAADIDGSIITDVLALLNQIRKRRGAGPFCLPNIL
jgi:adenine-specific DNA methylase